jgi:hypothetical protein
LRDATRGDQWCYGKRGIISDSMVRKQFASPDEFLEDLKARLSRPWKEGQSDPIFTAQARERLVNAGGDPALLEGRTRGFEAAVDNLKTLAIAALPAADRDRVLRSVAIGVLDIGSINARIIKGSEDIYAIVVHGGLMLLLHKIFKFSLAGLDPSAVTHCNRKPATELTRQDCLEYMHEVVNNCRTYGAPYGPLMHLSMEATATHGANLHVAELFILGHEIGHFLNGDLDECPRFKTVSDRITVEEYVEDEDHAKEFAADARGFEILRQAETIQSFFNELALIPPIVLLFNTFYMLAGGASSSHPDPLERSVRLVEHFYGAERAEALRLSYDDPTQLARLMDE